MSEPIRQSKPISVVDVAELDDEKKIPIYCYCSGNLGMTWSRNAVSYNDLSSDPPANHIVGAIYKPFKTQCDMVVIFDGIPANEPQKIMVGSNENMANCDADENNVLAEEKEEDFNTYIIEPRDDVPLELEVMLCKVRTDKKHSSLCIMPQDKMTCPGPNGMQSAPYEFDEIARVKYIGNSDILPTQGPPINIHFDKRTMMITVSQKLGNTEYVWQSGQYSMEYYLDYITKNQYNIKTLDEAKRELEELNVESPTSEFIFVLKWNSVSTLWINEYKAQ